MAHGEEDGAVDDGLKFADVAGPIVLLEEGEGFGVDSGDVDGAVAAAEAEEVLG